jgi:predicted DNA-binding antitoxin AbrB/MazE fold protein
MSEQIIKAVYQAGAFHPIESLPLYYREGQEVEIAVKETPAPEEPADSDERSRFEALDQARALRARLAAQGQQTDSVSALDEVREGRIDDFSSLR